MTRETKLGIGVSTALLILVALAIMRAWFGPEDRGDHGDTSKVVASATAPSPSSEEKVAPSSPATAASSKETTNAKGTTNTNTVVPADFKVPDTAHPGKLPDSLTTSAAPAPENPAASLPLPPSPPHATSQGSEPGGVSLPEPPEPSTSSGKTPSATPSPLQVAQAATPAETIKSALATGNEKSKKESKTVSSGPTAAPAAPGKASVPEKQGSDFPPPPAPPTGVSLPLPLDPLPSSGKNPPAGSNDKGNNSPLTTEELLSQQKAKAERQTQPPGTSSTLPGPASPPAPTTTLPSENSNSSTNPNKPVIPGTLPPEKPSNDLGKGPEPLPGNPPTTLPAAPAPLPPGPASLPATPANPSSASAPPGPTAPVPANMPVTPVPPSASPSPTPTASIPTPTAGSASAPAPGNATGSTPTAPPVQIPPVEHAAPVTGSVPTPVATGPSLVVAGGNTSPASPPQVRNYSVETFICTPEVRTFSAISRLKYGTEAYAHALWAYNRDWPGGESFTEENALLPIGQRVQIPPVAELERLRNAAPVGPRSPTPPASPATPASPVAAPVPASSWPSPVTASGPAAPLVPSPPAVPSATPPVALGRPSTDRSVTYQVRPGGEMLYEIARERLGDSRRWSEIYRLNPHIAPEQPVPGGTLLRLPADARIAP